MTALELAGHRRTLDGPGRLLKEMVKRGLREEDLRAAARLVMVLNEAAKQ